jgi:hypothetical protein
MVMADGRVSGKTNIICYSLTLVKESNFFPSGLRASTRHNAGSHHPVSDQQHRTGAWRCGAITPGCTRGY